MASKKALGCSMEGKQVREANLHYNLPYWIYWLVRAVG